MDCEQLLTQGCALYNIPITTQQITQFIHYKDLLLAWNQKMNLTAITDEQEIVIKHFLDSIALIPHINNLNSGIDVGTGAGFPGIPIKIMLPEIKITLLDSLQKRIFFLQEVSEQLHLKDIHMVHGRAEDLAKNQHHREQYDFSTSRAVARLNVLAEYCMGFVKEKGYFISLKGPKIEDELKEATEAIKILGGQFISANLVTIPFSDIRHSIIKIKKVQQTPSKFPRKNAKIERSPL